MDVVKKIKVVVLAVMAFALLGCGKVEERQQVEIAYVEWACATATANVNKAVLEERLGYDVELISVSAAAMWQAVASGDVDGITSAWLETTHGHYLEEVKEDVVDLGPNLVGTRIGLTVPEYVEIDSIEELNEHADRFDNEIIGIDPGAGIMSATEEAMQEYGLDEFTLVEGSGATMVATLADAIRNEEWVVVTGWVPHWKFGEWDLKFLEDPKLVYGEEEAIHTIVRENLETDMPQVYNFMDNFHWSPDDLHEVMAMIEEQEGTYEPAREWVRQNPEKVDEWIQ